MRYLLAVGRLAHRLAAARAGRVHARRTGRRAVQNLMKRSIGAIAVAAFFAKNMLPKTVGCAVS